MARIVTTRGAQVRFLASNFTARFLRPLFAAQVEAFGADVAQNRRIWDRTLREFRPEIVVFGDYPLLFFGSGTIPLADDAWVSNLGANDAAIVTLDHLGYAQRPVTLFFGPPHLSFHSVSIPNVPDRMRILLPCPLHEPTDVPGRRGIPFRYWPRTPERREELRQEVRQRYHVSEGGLLVFHSTPNWAWRLAEHLRLPHYAFLANILAYYLADIPRPITVLSVNNGALLSPPDDPNLRVLNLPPVPSDEYEQLLLACDLMITENGVSVGLGKAVCSLQPSAVLRNSHRLTDLVGHVEPPLERIVLAMERARLGAIFPYEVFPIWRREELQQLGLFDHNSLAEAFAHVELFGGEPTRRELQRLLLDDDAREALRARQRSYSERVATLDDADQVLRGSLAS